MTHHAADRAETFPLVSSADVVKLRHRARQLAVELGFPLVAQTKLVTAASELARNCIEHGGGGHSVLEPIRADLPRRAGLRLTFVDEGPGIADTAQALTPGWSSGHGLGLGLSGARALATEFDLESTPGHGTRVSILFWLGT